ncbi:hypothetical protein D9M73_267090 [compost metagenome]
MDMLGKRLHRALARNIQYLGHARLTQGRHLLLDILQCLQVDVGGDDVSATPGKRQRSSPTNAGAGTGDEDFLVLQFGDGHVSLRSQGK